MRNGILTEGEFFSAEDFKGRVSVAMIGPEVADKLFGRRAGIVGESIRIEGQPFRIAGVLASKGGGSFGSQDNVVLLPLSTAQARLINRSNNKYDIVYIQASSPEQINSATEEISQILRTRRRTEIGLDDFTVMSQQDFVSTAQRSPAC